MSCSHSSLELAYQGNILYFQKNPNCKENEEEGEMVTALPLVRIHSPINQECLISHIGIDQEHHDGLGDVFRLAQSANRNP
jgi:hypothetical protein